MMDDLTKKAIILDVIVKIHAKQAKDDKTLTVEDILSITHKDKSGWTSDYGEEYDHRFEGNGYAIIANNRAGGSRYTPKCIEFTRPDTFSLNGGDVEGFVLDADEWISEAEIQRAIENHQIRIKRHGGHGVCKTS